MLLILIIPAFWLVLLIFLFIWKRELFIKTWHEPYFSDTPILIESDDWGPGGKFHANRLQNLLDCLAKYKDSVNRSAVLTADVILTVPDTQAIKDAPASFFPRKVLDRHFPEIYKVMMSGVENDLLVPQLHGLEHLNDEAFATLCIAGDSRIAKASTDSNWWDWESLDSPLQAHYVNGSTLPTTPVPAAKAKEIIDIAVETFHRLFGYPSLTAVAPCYLWNDDVESEWSRHAIQAIQTAGYRCVGRARDGRYIQDKSLIRAGDKNTRSQIYLVRNVMYEPVDGKNTPASAYLEAIRSYRQALPITISTHRYNYTRSEEESRSSLEGLAALLSNLTKDLAIPRFLSSAELAEAMINPEQDIINHFNKKTWPKVKKIYGIAKMGPFLSRLYYRHPKLAAIAYISGLIIPCWLIYQIASPKKLH
jgi:hypothetical protein